MQRRRGGVELVNKYEPCPECGAKNYWERDAAEERVKQFAQALRSVCTELLQERGCYEGECGTDACSYSDCVVGPALKLLESLEREALP